MRLEDVYDAAYRSYFAAEREWEQAIGLSALWPIRRGSSVRYWSAAVAGELPGPIPRWPEPE